MLRKFWTWLIGPSSTDLLIAKLMEGQERQNKMVMEAISSIIQASQKQADVMNTYLKLFQTPGEPQTWSRNEEAENEDELLRMGFPAEATEKEQAEWILKNLDKM